MKLALLRTLTALLLLTGITQYAQAQAIGAGDLVFTGFNTFDDNSTGAIQNDAFSFVMLHDCPINTVISFTDLGWTGSHFQSTTCGAGNGPQTDGVLQWTNGNTVIRAGTQIVISCKFNPTATKGTVTTVTPTANAANTYISLGLAGDQLFAFTGNINAPTVIAGININRFTWDGDGALGDCDFTSSKSTMPATSTVLKFPNMWAVNARYKCLATIGSATNLRTRLEDFTQWNADNTMASPVPTSFDLIKTAPCNLTIVNPDPGGIVYVNNQSATPGDGSSWTTPLPELRDALIAAADPANGISQIWIAKGIYKPTATTDPSISFAIPSNLLIYGGFAGNESTIAARNIPANPVILSGDIEGNDGANIVLKASSITGTNSSHVITLSNTGIQTLLDGVIITAGQSNTIAPGGGIYSVNGNIKIVNTQFYGNYSNTDGGSIYAFGAGTIELTNSTFSGNQSGTQGGAIAANITGTLKLTNVTVTGNSSGSLVSGVFASAGSLVANNTIISGNSSPGGILDASFPSGTISYSILGDQYYTSTTTHQNTPAVQFTNVGAGDLRLTKNNFAINHGDPQTNSSGYPLQVGSVDLAKQPRINNTIIDLGAFEYQAVAQTITFPAFPAVTYGAANIDPGATTTGDSSVVYSSADKNIADTVAGKIKITGAGSVVITANAPATSGYLPATPQTQTLTIAQAPLTIKANDVSRVYKTANPDPTFTYTSFVNGEDSAKAITGLVKAVYGGDINAAAGTYTITPDLSATVAPNYALTAANGTLTITQAAQTITFPAITGKTYGDLSFALSATSTSGLPVTFTYVSGPATLSGNTLTITGAGDVKITANQAGDGNYFAATAVSQTFTVAKATLTVTANSKTKAYGQANPTLDYAITNFVTGDDISVVNGKADISTTADINSIPNSYPITVTAGTLSAANYLFNFVNSSLTVTQAAQTITFPAITGKTYGDAAFALNASSDANLTITYSVVSGPATISGNMLTITGTGNVTVTASQTGNTNYLPATPATQIFNIAPAVLTVKADSQSKTYLQPNPTLSYTIAGFVYGETNGVVTGTADISTTADVNSVPGSYPITVTTGTLATSNYTFSFVNSSLTVTQAAQTITLTPVADKTYGDLPIALSASSSSGLTITYSVVSGPATISGHTVTITGTGDITVAADQAGDANYAAAPQATTTFHVAKAVLSVTANSKSKAYLAPIPTLDYTITGFAYSESGSVVTGTANISTTATAGSAAGNYPITVTTGTLSATNYTFNFTNSLLTIDQAAQTITFAAPADKTYGDLPFALNASSNAGLTVAYTVASGPATISGNTVTITGTGTVSITASQAGDANYLPATSVTQSFDINKATLTLTADDKQKVFGANNPTLTYTYSGLAYSDDISVLSGTPVLSTTALTGSAPGPYPISITNAASLSAVNYNVVPAAGTLTVSMATQAITFAAPADMTYGDAPLTLSASSNSGLSVAFSVVSGPATISGNTLTITGAGDITVAADQAGNANYSAATQVTRTFHVAKAALTVTANDKTKVYLQANPTLDYTITGFVNGESVSVVTGVADISTTADINSGVNSYPITVSDRNLHAANYSFSFANGTLTVTPAAQTITFPAITDKTYGDAPLTLNASSNTGLPVAYRVVSGPATISGNTVTITGAGSITIAADQAGNGNYTAATPVTQSFNVAKASLTVTANSKTKAYLQANPTLDYTIAGFVNGESTSVVNGIADISTTADLNSTPGSYPITVTAGTLSTANYLFNFTNSTLTVTAAAQTITFAALADKTYGEVPFTLNASSDAGLGVTYRVLSGPATISGNTVTITGAGSVTIAADQAGNSNYAAATTVTQRFSVEKASLTVTANSKTKVYLQTNPTLDYTITGFVSGETTSVVNGTASINTTATSSSTPGSYPIAVTTGTLSAANYSFAFVPGSLVVTAGTQTITFASLSGKAYGDAPFAVNASSDAGLPVTYSVVSGPATISGNTVTITGAGNVTIAADQAGNSNYSAAAPVTQSFNVTKASLTVTANSKSKAYLQANPALDYTISGFVNGDPSSVVNGLAGITTTADINSTPGSYPITVTAGTLSAVNYDFSFVNSTLAVSKLSQTITFAAPANQTYGTAPVTLNASSSSGAAISYSIVSGPGTISANALTITGAGTIVVAADQAGNHLYLPATQVTQTINVAKALLTVTANSKTKAYLQPNPTLDYTITGFVNGDTNVSGSADISTTADASSAPGDYPVTVATGTLGANNYSFSFVNSILHVTQATQTITFAPVSNKTYGVAPFTLNGSSSAGTAVAYTVVSGPATVSGNTLTITGAGTVTVAANQPGDNNYSPAAQVTQTFDVTKALLAVTANSKTKIYLQPNPALDYTITGFVSNDNSSVVSGAADITTTADVNSAPGSYPISVTTGTLNTANYDFRFVNSTLDITLATQTITFVPVSGKTYGDAPFALQATSSAGLPVTYTVTSGPATLSGNMLTITGTGAINLAADQAGNNSYGPATQVTQTFTVSKAQLTVTANSKMKIYGQPNPALNYTISGFVYSDDNSVVSGAADISTTADVNSTPGTYPITLSAGTVNAANYTFRFVNSSLTVTAASQTITFAAISGKTYGEAPFVLSASSDAGLPVTYTITSGPANVNGNTLTITGAGTVTVTAAQTGNGSYGAATPVTNSFIVAPATLTVKATDQQKVAGANNPALTYTITGFVNGENNSVVTGAPVLGTNADNSSPAGTYPITVTAGTLHASNYGFNLVNGTLTVGQASQTITFPAISGKTYGDAPFTLNAGSSSGLPVTYTVVSGPATINGNTLTITGAGTITIEADQAGNSSYSPATASQTFAVSKVPLTVKAGNDTRTYTGNAYTGGNGVSYSGFVNGDDASKLSGTLTYSGSAQGAINAATYVITPAGLNSNNYNITYVNGELTITRATQQIVFTAIGDKNEGDPDFTLVASSSSGLPVTFSSDNANVISISGNTAHVGTGGTVQISAAQAGNSNYEPATTVTQTIQVSSFTAPVITAGGSLTFCEGNSVKLTSSTAPAYEWYRNGIRIPRATGASLTADETGLYMVKAIYNNNVTIGSAPVSITVHPLPDGNIQAGGSTTISKGASIRLTASGGNTYAWDPATGLNDPNIASPVARPAVTTTYQVTITNLFRCSTTKEITITVKDDYKLEASNILTPNGDGKNDLWIVKNIDMYPQNEVKIYDRAGRMVYHQRGYTNNWNGTINGQVLAEGTYYYIITLGDNKPQFKGFITVVHQN
jgi:gliding motility-associated-like protein